MKIADIISTSEKPVIYEKGTSFMWTDEHISNQLLDIHLNPDIDLASRKMSTISKTAKWILDSQKAKGQLKILDLGCGPGLYSEIFSQMGHNVTGVDISKNSLDYARKSAQNKGLDIEYINASYIDYDLEEEKYDLVLLIFTDFGVLAPNERESLLRKVYRALKKGGVFIFDVLKDNQLEQKVAPKNWEVTKSGFWKDSPYLVLSESFLYEEQKVILYQHVVIDSDEGIESYRFWTHFFSRKDLTQLLENSGFCRIHFRDDILPDGNMWNGDNVIFSVALKNR
ncbi:class I SAM-dependent methyltransferase [Mariniphaga sediminis]|uniref:Class I SAM-dependent methyltransferase n=1 Tax=Mariniphaga sediminis TaxID=1628158 RepID=A0A399D8X2_9BACT|nr:class I SAM-dependent methyltransferase [Mariniphaga sediminis]RIH66650.1 class I SAM-dependent methyltransferase [Mariniphaga sediminis]